MADDNDNPKFTVTPDKDGGTPKVVVQDVDSGNPKVVVLRTKTDESRQRCIAKLRLLLEEAENGRLRDVIIIGFRGDSEVTMHWTPQTDANGIQFVGALHTMANLLVSRMKVRAAGS